MVVFSMTLTCLTQIRRVFTSLILSMGVFTDWQCTYSWNAMKEAETVAIANLDVTLL
jgi:hypothetical protein